MPSTMLQTSEGSKRKVLAHMSDYTPLFTCRKCKESLPRTPEYFALDKRCTDGMGSYCRKCKSADDKRYREQNADKVKATKRAWQQENREYLLQYFHDYRVANLEKIRSNEAQYAKEHRDHKKEYDKEYRKKNEAQIRQYKAVWVKNNPLKVKASSHRRIAMKESVPCTFTDNDWLRALNFFDHKCAVCGRPIGLWHTLAADHWIPLTSDDCPGTIPTNIVPLCHGVGGCNNSKGTKNAVGWVTEKFGKRKAREILKRIEQYFEWVRAQDE